MPESLDLTDPIKVADNLWATNILPEGTIESWLYTDGSLVEAGNPVATIQIEDALHDVMAPCKGRLHVGCRANTIIEPGMTIGHIDRKV